MQELLNYMTSGLFQLALLSAIIILPLWAIFDCLKTFGRKGYRMNIIWLLIIIFFPIVGSIIYFQVGKRSMRKVKRKFSPDFSKVRK